MEGLDDGNNFCLIGKQNFLQFGLLYLYFNGKPKKTRNKNGFVRLLD